MEGTFLSLSISSGPSFNLTVIITHLVAAHNLRWNCPSVFLPDFFPTSRGGMLRAEVKGCWMMLGGTFCVSVSGESIHRCRGFEVCLAVKVLARSGTNNTILDSDQIVTINDVR